MILLQYYFQKREWLNSFYRVWRVMNYKNNRIDKCQNKEWYKEKIDITILHNNWYILGAIVHGMASRMRMFAVCGVRECSLAHFRLSPTSFASLQLPTPPPLTWCASRNLEFGWYVWDISQIKQNYSLARGLECGRPLAIYIIYFIFALYESFSKNQLCDSKYDLYFDFYL